LWPEEESAATFCRRWVEKALQYDDGSLSGAFDQFFSLFVAYNRLYCQLAAESGLRGKGDHCEATRRFAEIVGPEALASVLDAPGAQEDLGALASLIAPDGGFFVTVSRKTGAPDSSRDRELHGLLTSQSASERVEGLLEFLYQVRCNMFHGRKNFEHDQLRILRPCSRLLRNVIEVGLPRLK